MQHDIINGAPLVSHLGTDDKSANQIPREPLGFPQHLPKFFFFGEKGSVIPRFCSGADRNLIFGEKSFSPISEFATHSTPLANITNREGNQCMYQRVVPEDAKASNITIWLDVLKEDIILYERLDDGSFKLDLADEKIPTGSTTPGYIVKFVKTFESDQNLLSTEFSGKHRKTGTQTNSAGDQSTMYPIKDLVYDGPGEAGNNVGIKIWAPTLRTDTYNSNLPNKLRVFPYVMSVVKRKDKRSSFSAVTTVLGERQVPFSFKESARNTLTGQNLFIGDILREAYSNEDDPRYAPIYGDFKDTFVYTDEISYLLDLFHEAEIPFINELSDFTDKKDDIHLFNFVSGVSLSNAPYHSFEIIDEADSIRLNRYTAVSAEGGENGTMNNETYDRLVAEQCDRYADPMDEFMDMAIHIESDIYDSGFSMESKYSLINVISRRPDIMLYLSPFVSGEADLTRSEELGIMLALMTRIEVFPESVYFGTSSVRAVVIPGSAIITNDLYGKRTTLLVELASKAAKMMGSSDGYWKESESFDKMPGSALTITKNINYRYMPVPTRVRYWDAGLNWVNSYNRSTYAFPVIKTVFRKPTSVLNSFFFAKAICRVNKVIDAVWRDHVGDTTHTDLQLVDLINEDIRKLTTDRHFANHVHVVPDVTITEMDGLRNFSITVPVTLYGNTPFTVMETYLIARNKSEL